MSRSSVDAVAHSGLVGDRWFRDARTEPLRRAYAALKRKEFGCTNVSIITLGEIEQGNRRLVQLAPECELFTPLEMRRNIVLTGELDMNSLLGVEFSIGAVRFVGDNLCTPCKSPPARAGKLKGREQLFKDAFDHPNHGGLRARILVGGTIHLGDAHSR